MKINIIWGCPASGKSTYVSEHRGKNDITFDFDLLMMALSGLDMHTSNTNLIGYVTDIRDGIIKRIKTEKKLQDAWIIVTWVDDEFKEQFKDYKSVEYILMDTTEEECLDRINNNDDRQASKDEQVKVVKEWFKKYKEQDKRKRLLLCIELAD